jgi:hypothetical protein
MDSEKTEFALEHNPLYQLLVIWIERGGMKRREFIDSKTLFAEMAAQYSFASSFPYKNAGALSRALTNLKSELTGWIEIEKMKGGNNKTLWKIHPGEKLDLTLKEKQGGQAE